MNKELEIIKSNPYIKQLINKTGLSDEQISNNTAKIIRVLESRSKCEGCKGLCCCSQLAQGQRFCLTNNGILMDEVEYCDYALSKLDLDNLAKSYLYCDVPEHLLDLDLSNIKYNDDQKQLFLRLSNILTKKNNKGVYIVGDLGVGKTYLSIALANSLVKNNERVAFVKVANFFNEIKSYISNRSEQLDINIAKLKKADYLFFDDIGAETVSEFVRDDILFRVLDYRLENNLTTIFTSNLDKDKLMKHYQFDRKDNSNIMNAKRLVERIDILAEDFILSGRNMRR